MDEQTLKDIDRAFKALEERDELLDKIRAEIQRIDDYRVVHGGMYVRESDVVKIIDKYRKEQEWH